MTINGIVETIRYNKDDFSIFTLRLDADQPPFHERTTLVPCKGNVGVVESGEHLRVAGEDYQDPTWGWQMNASAVYRTIPTTIEGIKGFLMHMHGIQTKTADAIIREFGVASIDVIKSSPEKVADVLIGKKRIGNKRAKDFQEHVVAASADETTMMFLGSIGMTDKEYQKVKTEFGEGWIALVQSNPYCTTKVKGIGFKRADYYAKRLGFEASHPFRIRAGILYALELVYNTKGSVYLPEDDLVSDAAAILEQPFDPVLKIAQEMEENGGLIKEEDHVYSPDYYKLECFIADKLKAMLNASSKAQNVSREKLFRDIQAVEAANHVSLDETQREAVRKSLADALGSPDPMNNDSNCD